MLYGEYRHTIDAKGRLFIPSKLRAHLGEEFVISRGFDKCVCIYPTEEWEIFCTKIEELSVAKDRRIRHFFFSGACDGNTDSQGRVTIPNNYRDYASLDREVVIIGNRTHLEIWSLSAWEEELSRINPDDITDELIKLGF